MPDIFPQHDPIAVNVRRAHFEELIKLPAIMWNSSTSAISDMAFDQTAQLLNRCDVTPVFSSILSESFPAL
mgnify:FL=1